MPLLYRIKICTEVDFLNIGVANFNYFNKELMRKVNKCKDTAK